MMLDRLKAWVPLRLGTIVTSRSPAGRRTIFYRDKAGQHWSLEQLVFPHRPPNTYVALLAPPQYYRNLLNSYEDVIRQANSQLPPCAQLRSRSIRAERGVNFFPLAMRAMFFEDFKGAFCEMVVLGVKEFVWDPSGIYTLKLFVEKESGTYALEKTYYGRETTIRSQMD